MRIASTPLPLAARIASSKSARPETSKISSLTFNSLPAISTSFLCIGPVAGSHKTVTLLSCSIDSLSNSNSFFAEFRKIEKYARHLATWPRKIIDETATDWIGFQIERNDGNGGGRRPSGRYRGRTDCEDDIDLALDQLDCERIHRRGIPVARTKAQSELSGSRYPSL